MRFPLSVEEAKHGWRTAMHLQGRNGVENRNGAYVMEFASLDPCEDENEGRGKIEKGSLGWNKM
jgi:hypothetical protein